MPPSGIAPDARLSAGARAFINSAASAGEQIALSPNSLVEMVYLIEKHKIPAESLSRLERVLQAVPPTFIEIRRVSPDVMEVIVRKETVR